MKEYLAILRNAPRPLDLSLFPPPPGLRLWIVAPHPDDFDAIGLTLHFFFRNGAELFLDVLSGSSSGVEDGFAADCRTGTKERIREKEQEDSVTFFGLPLDRLQFLRFPEDEQGDLQEGSTQSAALEQRLHTLRPHLLFLPHGNDTNAGHRRTWRMISRLKAGQQDPFLILLIRDPKTIRGRTDAFFPFGEKEAEWKGQLLRCHRSQQSRNLRQRGHGFDERILRLNRSLALELGVPAVHIESFELPAGSAFHESSETMPR